MATSTTTVTELIDRLMGAEVEAEAKKALSTSNPFWQGIEWFLTWLRTKVREFFVSRISQLPYVGRWAARIGSTATELIFTVIETFCGFMKVVFTSASLWAKAHASSMLAWEANEPLGLLAQSYGYGKKMASYYLEIMNQCLQRAIKAHNLEATEQDKLDITSELDKILG